MDICYNSNIQYLNNGISVTITVLTFIFLMLHISECFRDPFAEDLRKRLRQLEDENARLVDQNIDLKYENNRLMIDAQIANVD
jgi:hypothetical protein